MGQHPLGNAATQHVQNAVDHLTEIGDSGMAIARSRNVHGKSNHSNQRERLYARVVNVRNDNHHKATTAIAKSAGRVVVETLNVAGIMMNRRLARAIADAGMSSFLAKVELPGEAGVQVPLVRRGVREGGPVVRVTKAVLTLRLEERRPNSL